MLRSVHHSNAEITAVGPSTTFLPSSKVCESGANWKRAFCLLHRMRAQLGTSYVRGPLNLVSGKEKSV